MYKATARIKCDTVVHLRPAVTVCRFANIFPNTELHLVRSGFEVFGDLDTPGSGINLKSMLSVSYARLGNGTAVTIQAVGRNENLAVEIMKITLENLDAGSLTGSCDDYIPKVMEGRILGAIEDRYGVFPDPDIGRALAQLKREIASEKPTEYSVVSKTNDNFHKYTAPILPFIVRKFGCAVELRYNTASSEIRCIRLDPHNLNGSIRDILSADPTIGSVVTVVSDGKSDNSKRVVDCISAVLKNLKQCDEWLRTSRRVIKHDETVEKFILFADSFVGTTLTETETKTVCRWADLLDEQRILIFSHTSMLTKDDAIQHLINPHAARHGLDYDILEKAVKKAEEKGPIILKKGLAVSHATLRTGPRVSLTLGVFQKGIIWSENNDPIQVACLYITADDTHGTYRRYLAQMSTLFRYHVSLIDELCQCNNAREALNVVSKAEDDLEREIKTLSS